MIISRTLSTYIARQYVLYFLFLMLTLLAVVYLFDSIELLRRAAKQDDVPFKVVMLMSVLKLPEVGQQIFPFAILFSAMFAFWRLTRTNELVVVRSAGYSVWQFMAPILLAAFLIGCIKVAVIGPVSAVMLAKYEVLESRYLDRKESLITVSSTGLWLRQSHDGGGHTIIHSEKLESYSWTLKDVTVFFFDRDFRTEGRIDAPRAILRDGYWGIENATVNEPAAPTRFVEHFRLPTVLTTREIEESFSSPETLSFWRLPEFIRTLQETGFSAARFRMYYHALLAEPAFFAAMVLLAAAVSLTPPRFQGTGFLIMLGAGLGFFIFFIDSFLQAFGISQKIPVLLAAWAPPSITSLLGVATILHLEDG